MTPLVLVHGLIGSLNAPLVTRAFSRRVLAPDLLGYGPGPAPSTPWTLDDQAAHLGAIIEAKTDDPVDLVGHSVGGAVAWRLSLLRPDLVRSLTSVEGNFSLGDAFWSRQIASQPLAEVEAALAVFRSDVGAWLRRSGVDPTEAVLAIATDWLDNQPASTVQTQARAVVRATTDPAYLEGVRDVLGRGLPLHLVAGERTAAGWTVPDWVRAAAVSDVVAPGTGHLLMIENPGVFAALVEAPLSPPTSRP